MIANVLDIIYSFSLDHIISMSVPFERHLFCQNPMYDCGVIGVESRTIPHTFAVIFAATAPYPRWRAMDQQICPNKHAIHSRLIRGH